MAITSLSVESKKEYEQYKKQTNKKKSLENLRSFSMLRILK